MTLFDNVSNDILTIYRECGFDWEEPRYINIFRWLLISVLMRSIYCYSHGMYNVNFFSGGTYLADFINSFVNFRVNIGTGGNSIFMCMLLVIWWRLFYRMGAYIEKIGIYYYTLFMERKRIKKIPFGKLVLYSLTWPIFDIVGRYTTYIALFKKVSWKPVPHNSKITIDDINKEKEKSS